MRRLINCGCAGLAIASFVLPAAAQRPAERGTFLTLRGDDTIAVERFAVSHDTARGTLLVNGGGRQEYREVFRPDGTMAAVDVAIYSADAAANASPATRLRFEIYPDSINMIPGGHIRVPRGAMPAFDLMFSETELWTRHARENGGRLDAPLWAGASAPTARVNVQAEGADSMVVTVSNLSMRFRVDSAGAILGGVVPAQGLRIVRLDSDTGFVHFGRTAPVLPAGIVERDVTVPGPVPLPGTLTLPAGHGPFPAVVLVQGSGASDRDETGSSFKPFRDLAWGLAQQGVAVLRYDKRDYVAPEWQRGRNITVYDETIQDALSALKLVRTEPDVDAARTFELGHSLGGIVSPRIAAADRHVAGIIIMAGATRGNMIDNGLRQWAFLESIPGADTATIAQQRRELTQIAARIKALKPVDSLDNTPFYHGEGTRYWLDMKAYDPAAVMRTVHLPALVLQGEHDYNVPPEQLDDWLRAVGPRSNITVKRYPDLDHLFMHTSSTAAAPEPGAHVDPQVISDIAAWIHAH